MQPPGLQGSPCKSTPKCCVAQTLLRDLDGLLGLCMILPEVTCAQCLDHSPANRHEGGDREAGYEVTHHTKTDLTRLKGIRECIVVLH